MSVLHGPGAEKIRNRFIFLALVVFGVSEFDVGLRAVMRVWVWSAGREGNVGRAYIDTLVIEWK